MHIFIKNIILLNNYLILLNNYLVIKFCDIMCYMPMQNDFEIDINMIKLV